MSSTGLLATGRSRPVVGILGGMGPAAGASFYGGLVASTGARRDQDHLRLVLWADPSIPDRTEALLGAGPSPVPAMLHGLRWLKEAGVAFVAMPCNTAHAFRDELEARAGVELLDMVEASVDTCRSLVPGLGRIGVLCTRGTRQARLYEDAAGRAGLRVVQVDEHVQRTRVDAAIAILKAGADLAQAGELLSDAVAALAAGGAEIVVAACTEISLVRADLVAGVPVIDSTDCLAELVHQRVAELAARP